MNSKQLYDMLLGYPVTICTADQLKIQEEDSSFPIQTRAKVKVNTGWHFTSLNVVLSNFFTPWDIWQKTMELDLKRS